MQHLELDDQEWLDEYAQPAANLIKAEFLVVTVAPKKSEEQVAKEEAAALEAAKKLIAKADAVRKRLSNG